MVSVLVDFDGTITAVDLAEQILREFTGEAWWPIEQEFRSGKIGSREALTRQFGLIHASKRALVEFLGRVSMVDKGFPTFVENCSRREIPVEIASDGFDFYIEPVLSRLGLQIPFTANSALFGENRVIPLFPHANLHCVRCGGCANCKLDTLNRLKRRGAVYYVGDGHSDIPAALQADRVYAKGELRNYLEGQGHPHRSFQDFRELSREVDDWESS